MPLNEHRHLALANQHIQGAKRRIAQQHSRIEQLHLKGGDTDLAERFLAVMESTLRCYETHRQIIQERIRRSGLSA